jgi:hypothetical protein
VTVLRGGALEPRILASLVKKAWQSSGVMRSWYLPVSNGWELFSLRRGLECSYVLFKLGITSSFIRFASETTKATRWVALDPMAMRLRGLACTPPVEGPNVAAPERDGRRLLAGDVPRGSGGRGGRGWMDECLHGQMSCRRGSKADSTPNSGRTSRANREIRQTIRACDFPTAPIFLSRFPIATDFPIATERP